LKEQLRSGEVLKQSSKKVKQIDVFIFTDERTLLRSETSKSGKAYKRYIVHPLTVIAQFEDSTRMTIARSKLIEVFGPHYLSLFYSEYFVIKTDFKINIAAIDATPTVKGDYANYGYSFKPVDDKMPGSIKLAKTCAVLEPPVVQEFKPKRYLDFDYTDLDLNELDDECV
jgi:hypothetical protein